MKKTLIAVSLLTLLSTGAMAKNISQEQQKIDADMASLETSVPVLVQIEKDIDTNAQQVEYKGFVISEYKDIYVTHHDAKKMGLEKVHTFHVYNQHNIDTLSADIAKHIEKDQPDFFSVDLYKDYYGDSGVFRYVARVIEYR